MSNRREFLKQIGASAVGFAMSGLGGVMLHPSHQRNGVM